MSDPHAGITDNLRDFIADQHVFFVATAPLARDAHVNLSPKGLDCFQVLGPDRVGYLDVTGSGNETAAHLQENGRITFMFCSFGRNAKILRLQGTGRTVLPGSEEWEALSPEFPDIPGARQIILADLDRVSTSCGFGVPVADGMRERETLVRWAESRGPEALADYRRQKNTRSIDGLPVEIE